MIVGNTGGNLQPGQQNGNREDLINATNIHVGIASQLFAASLVLIGVFLAYFDSKHFELSTPGGFLTASGIILLIASLFCGGVGLKKIRESGRMGDWTLDTKHHFFRMQTLLNILAIILFGIVFLMSPSADSDELNEMKETNKLLKEMLEHDASLEWLNRDMMHEMDSLKNIIKEMQLKDFPETRKKNLQKS